MLETAPVVDDDPQLRDAWAEQIPVTLVDGRQHDYWRVDETRLRAALAAPPDPAVSSSTTTLWQRMGALGKPLLVGMALSAAVSGLLAYGLITVGWRLQVLYKRRKRRQT